MRLFEKEISMPTLKGNHDLLAYLESHVSKILSKNQIPVRAAFTKTDERSYRIELGVLEYQDSGKSTSIDSIFRLEYRQCENIGKFNAVLLIPTGIGAELGGHSGDGGPLSKLMASVCDTLITHPNVVNAADVNELPENGLYVEGSVISRLLMGTVGLQKVRSNRVALIMDDHDESCISEHTINSASTARAALGLNCPLVIKVSDKIGMYSEYSEASGCAAGKIDNLENLVKVLEEHRDKYDAVALASTIKVPKKYHTEYFLTDMVNPWGGVEAMLTHSISSIMKVPSAHAPMVESSEISNLNVGVVEPRKAAEAVSLTYLHCVFKGLHKAPMVVSNGNIAIQQQLPLSVDDIDFMITPINCVGTPHYACMEAGIPIIAVRENKTILNDEMPYSFIVVDNYLEAAGMLMAYKSGINSESVRHRRSINTSNTNNQPKEKLPKTQYLS